MKIKLNLYLKEVVLFGATFAVGIFSAHQYFISPVLESLPEVKFDWSDIAFLSIAVLFFLLASKYKKLGRISFRIFLVLVVFSGTQVVAGSLFLPPIDLLFTLAVILIFIFVRNVISHNLGILLGIAGIGSVLGLSISPKTAVLIMIVLSFYDIVAVYITKHMVRMAKDMMDAGAIFGFIIPTEVRGFFSKKHEAHSQIGKKFMILGSGDVGLPVILVSSMVPHTVSGAVIVAVFSLAGLFATHLIFINQRERKPMAALPPIAIMSAIGYLIVSIF